MVHVHVIFIYIDPTRHDDRNELITIDPIRAEMETGVSNTSLRITVDEDEWDEQQVGDVPTFSSLERRELLHPRLLSVVNMRFVYFTLFQFNNSNDTLPERML
jgi:hypothetical protein